MGQPSNEDVVNAYLRAYTANDESAMRALRHTDWMVEYPQSGERIRGHANERAIAAHYPGGLPEIDPQAVIGSEDHWVVSPSFTYERIVGSGDSWFVRGRALYPDRSTWYVASILHLRDGLIHHEITYWAEPFEPPAWRAQWVEPAGPPPA
jgi:SnoaL-like domain